MTTPINRYIDHSVLKPEMTQHDAAAAIELGLKYDCKAVAVRPADIPLAIRLCKGTDTLVAPTLAFPHGVGLAASKAAEARLYVDMGAGEIDMVANYGLFRSGLWPLAQEEIAAVTAITNPAKVTLKVILETSALTIDEIKRATEVCIAAGAQFVKSSTGFSEKGATPEAIAAMLQAAGGRIQVKASGGIRDRATAENYIAMGCTRIGVGYAVTPIICG